MGALMLKLGAQGDPFAAVAVTFATPLLALTVLPWSSNVTLLAITVALAIATSPRPPAWGSAVLLGVAAGTTFSARHVDCWQSSLVARSAAAR